MLFDEPTSALDPELHGSVLSVMQDLAAAGMTMIVVTHELGFARSVGNRIIFMDQGRAIEEADAREFDNPKTDRARKFLSEIN
jgi:ABC-type polar amino acid transport system ATPase subunit